MFYDCIPLDIFDSYRSYIRKKEKREEENLSLLAVVFWRDSNRITHGFFFFLIFIKSIIHCHPLTKWDL